MASSQARQGLGSRRMMKKNEDEEGKLLLGGV